jgi:hypothetical protein
MNSCPERRTCPSCAFAAKWNARVIDGRVVGGDRVQQPVDELLMLLGYLDGRH